MKKRPGARLALVLASLALLAAPGLLRAQEQPPVVVAPTEPIRRTAEELETLLGPIALYPDALIALVLPAAAAPVDIVLAARFLKESGDPNQTGSRAWDESVKSLVHYPDVVTWMDDNIEWTKQVGEAFLNQPDEVMKAIQRLRERARAAGTLVSTPQQTVAWDSGIVTIIPAQPDVIYVPRYEPDYVYFNRPVNYSQPIITFGLGFAVGPWLTHDCDWPGRRIWVVNRQWSWRDRRDWRHPVFPGHPGYVATPHRQPWRPAPDVVRPPVSLGWGARPVNRPVPMAGAPVAAFATNTTTTTTAINPTPPRRDRGPDARRPANPAATDLNAPTSGNSPTTPVSQWTRPQPGDAERRSRPANPPASTRPAAPAMPAPAQAVANTPTPDRRHPPTAAFTSPNTAPAPTPATSPAPARPATQPRQQISMAPAAAPAPSTPPRAATAPSQPSATATPARPAANPNPPPPSREDRDNARKKVEQ